MRPLSSSMQWVVFIDAMRVSTDAVEIHTAMAGAARRRHQNQASGVQHRRKRVEPLGPEGADAIGVGFRRQLPMLERDLALRRALRHEADVDRRAVLPAK